MHQAADKSDGEAAALGPRSEGGVGLRKKGQGLGNRAFGNNSEGSYFFKKNDCGKGKKLFHPPSRRCKLRVSSKPHTWLAWGEARHVPVACSHGGLPGDVDRG